MGIPGLTTYINNRSDIFFDSYELHDSAVVIDGNSLASQLYREKQRSHSVFGGDYDEYETHVLRFFNALSKCNVKAYVIVDGGHEVDKVPTIIKRHKSKLTNAYNVSINPIASKSFFPISMDKVFIDAVKSLNVPIVTADFEADNEVAALAQFLQCPVLSFDSDFFIFDVQYIPFSHFRQHPVLASDGDTQYYYMNCSMYNINKFCTHFSGLEKSALPMLAVVLGNDRINRNIFTSFLGKNDSSVSTDVGKRIARVSKWLLNENIDAAKEKVQNKTKKGDSLMVQIKKSISSYDCTGGSALCTLGFAQSQDECDLRLSNVSPWFLKKFREANFQNFIMDMVALKTYFTAPCIEDQNSECCHTISLPIIKAIYSLLHLHVVDVPSLTFYTRNGKVLKHLSLVVERPIFFEDYKTLDQLVAIPQAERQNIFFKCLNLTDSERNIISDLPNDWKLFFMAYIYWISNSGDLIASVQHCVLFGFILMHIVRHKIGYFMNLKTFMSKRGKHYHEAVKEFKRVNLQTQLSELTLNGMTLKEIISSITEKACLVWIPSCIELQKDVYSEKQWKKQFSIKKVHALSKFQSCLFHCVHLNTLLNSPFDTVNWSQVYSGTFYYKLSDKFAKQMSFESWVDGGAGKSSSIYLLYSELTQTFKSYLKKLP